MQTPQDPNREMVTTTPSTERDAKDVPSRSNFAPPELPKNVSSIPRRLRDFASLSIIYPEGAILDSHRPSQYGPRDFGGGTVVILPEPSRVSKAWPTTHAKKLIANTPRPTRLRSPRGLSVSASVSARSSPTVLPKVVRVKLRRPIRQRSPFRLSTELCGRCRHRLAGRSLAWNLALGDDRVSAPRLRSRGAQRDARGGSSGEQHIGPTRFEAMNSAAAAAAYLSSHTLARS